MSENSLEALLELGNWMQGTGRQANTMIVYPGDTRDVLCLALIGNGDGWEAVNETGTYDLWFEGEPKMMNLTLEHAGRYLLDEYEKAKAERVLARMAPDLTGKARKEALAMIRGEIREQGSRGTWVNRPEGEVASAVEELLRIGRRRAGA